MNPSETPPVAPDAGRRTRIVLAAVMVPLVVTTVVALWLLWPHRAQPPPPPDDNSYHNGQVLAMRLEACPPDQGAGATPTGIPVVHCGSVDVKMADGPNAGQVVTTPVPGGAGTPTVEVGDKVVLLLVTDPADPTNAQYNIVDHQRGQSLILITAIFALAIVVFGRWRGLAALGGLAISFAVLLVFIVPGILAGRPPLLTAVVGASAIMFGVLYLTHGISIRTSIAVAGTLVSLILTGAAGTLAASATHLTGFGDENAYDLANFYRNTDLHGLLLAGIIIGSLGVLDDVTVTQAVTVSELAAADPNMSRLNLYRAAARVGRAHIASVVNTLILAYAGASLPVLLLIFLNNDPVTTVITGPFIAEEIVRSVVGTLGLIAAVPVTTALAALVTIRPRPITATPTDAPGPRPRSDPDGAALAAGRHAIATPWRIDDEDQ